jgi:membrane-associated phospholipid phosphatase
VNTAARIISGLFHPLLMPTWLVFILAVSFPWALQPARPENLTAYLLLVVGLTFILPAINIGFFRWFGHIRSFNMPAREERLRPFLLTLLLYAFCTFLFYYKLKMGLSDNFFKLLLILNALVFVAWLLTWFVKVSIHSLSAAAVPVILLVLSRYTEEGQLFPALLISIVMAGLVMSARLQLQAHTLREVGLGAVAGAVTAAITGIVLF